MACSHFEQGEAGITVDHATWRQHSPQPDFADEDSKPAGIFLAREFRDDLPKVIRGLDGCAHCRRRRELAGEIQRSDSFVGGLGATECRDCAKRR